VFVPVKDSLKQYWLVVGNPEHWAVAFQNDNVWGLQATKRAWWEKMAEGDGLVFYVTRPVGGAIGLGTVVTKFRQDKPLWPKEVQTQEVLWPYRFEFDVDFCFRPDEWASQKLQIDALTAVVQAGFQPLKLRAREATLQAFSVFVDRATADSAPVGSLHEELQRKLVERGKIQKFLAEAEYPMDGTRLDAVWRRVEKSVPTYVFEIHVGGDIYHALAKLKHAYDLWNSRIFLIAAQAELPKVNSLLSGTFHEIRERLKFVDISKLEELYSRKKAYRQLEDSLGIA
jgi:predicted RNA-binding protein